MAKLSSAPFVYVETDAVSSGPESWTLETLRSRYHMQPLSKENVHRALADRDALLTVMEARNQTDPKILEMCDYLMDIRHQFVRMILDAADLGDRNAESLREQARNI